MDAVLLRIQRPTGLITLCKDSDLYPVIRRNITLDARVSTTTLRGRTSSVTCQAARITRRWVRRLGGFIVLTDDDVDDIVAYLKLLCEPDR